MRIKFSHHVIDKLATMLLRKDITKELLEEVIKKPDEVLYDTVTERYVALRMKQKLAIIYEKSDEEIFIITALYSNMLEDIVQRRKRSGRWI